ncbi:hypothetical protein [Radiobacillus sp. PE A8.2]|uniref:hypothetical protein n=1 Tax=Radiobacillus sp. PE A8.2 TaxID=3380349 RepID=UPI00388FBBCE
MDRIENFLSGLQEWSSSINNGEKELSELIMSLSQSLGGKLFTKDIKQFEERIRYLVKEVKIGEMFLVNSLINEVDNVLNRRINSLGEKLSFNEFSQELDRAEFGIVTNMNKQNDYETVRENIENYEEQIDKWNFVKSSYFTKSKERQWLRSR